MPIILQSSYLIVFESFGILFRKKLSKWANALVFRTLDSQSRSLGSERLGGCMIDAAFHPSEVNQISTSTSGDFANKSIVSPQSGFVVSRQWNPFHKNGHKFLITLSLKFHKWKFTEINEFSGNFPRNN